MAIGMAGFAEYLGNQGRNAAYCRVDPPEGNSVVGILTGPFTEEVTVNYDDYIMGNMSSGINGISQALLNLNLKADIGLKATDFQKRTFTVDLMFFTWENNESDVMLAFKTLESFALSPSVDAKIVYKTPPNLVITIGACGSSATWFKKGDLFISHVSGEYGPSVDSSGNPYFITANITFLEALTVTAKDVMGDFTKGATSRGKTFLAK